MPRHDRYGDNEGQAGTAGDDGPVPSAAEVGDAERRADKLAREGAAAEKTDAADAEFARLDEARAAAYEAEAQRQADHRRRHNEFVDAENEKSAAHRREQDEETARRGRLAADLARHDAAVEARKRPDLADLRRGRWYDEKPITSTNTGSGVSGMASIEEVRGGISASNEKANEGLGAVQQAHAALEEAQAALMHATEGSGQADVGEALGLLAQSVNDLDTVRQQVTAAISAAESVANRL